MSKVTVVGAGAVGATCANVMACREVASEVVLIDIKEGLSEGKMLDMYQCSTLMDFDTKLVGVTNDYKQTANSDVVVITSGIPRKPGMTREELIGTNANIMKGVIENVVKYSPRAIIIVVANPMDTLTYLALKASGLPKNRIIGMGGALDSSRFKCYLAKATGANINNVDGMVIGGHGDTTMIPLVSKATVNGVPVSQFASKKKLDEAVANTMVGGATLTKLIGTSAWYAPGAASAMMVEAILNDQKKMIPCSCYLEGEYGQLDICIGVPAIIGRKGIEKIVKIDLSKEEAEKFAASADAVRKTNNSAPRDQGDLIPRCDRYEKRPPKGIPGRFVYPGSGSREKSAWAVTSCMRFFVFPSGRRTASFGASLFADQKLNFAPTNQLRGSDGP